MCSMQTKVIVKQNVIKSGFRMTFTKQILSCQLVISKKAENRYKT